MSYSPPPSQSSHQRGGLLSENQVLLFQRPSLVPPPRRPTPFWLAIPPWIKTGGCGLASRVLSRARRKLVEAAGLEQMSVPPRRKAVDEARLTQE